MAFTTTNRSGTRSSHGTTTRQQLTLAVNTLTTIHITATTETELTEYAALARQGSRQIESILLQIASRAQQLHNQGHSGSPEDILASGGQISRRKAKQEASRAKAVADTPELGDALADGDVSGEHVDSISRAKKGLTKEQQEHFDVEELTDLAKDLAPDEFDTVVKQAAEKAKHDWGLGRSIEERETSRFNMWRDRGTGMGRFSGWLDPERYDALKTQVENETASLANARKNDPRLNNTGKRVLKDEHLAMDALCSLVEKGTANSGGLPRPMMYVHVDHETATAGPHYGDTAKRETDSGHQMPPETIQRLLCDSIVVPLLTEEGRPVKVGRKHRTATDAQIAVLKAMYDTCGWHGCTIEVGWCQMHHVTFWENGGDTDLNNLVPLCSHHHHNVHDEHWGLHLAADRTLTIKRPDGATWRVSHPERHKQPTSKPPRKPANTRRE